MYFRGIMTNNKWQTGFTASAFDLLHAGHVLMLEEAKSVCDYLIVGLQLDPTVDRQSKNKPVQTIVERYIQLSACKYVDEVIPYSTEKDLEDILAALPIHVRILGEEYKNQDFTGRDICKKKGIELYFNQRNHSFSSSDLRIRVAKAEHDKKQIRI
jgi:glycerol-3-phosphate cytidylyltransferase